MTTVSGARPEEPASVVAESAGEAACMTLQLPKQKSPAAVTARQWIGNFTMRSSVRIGCDSAQKKVITRHAENTAGGIKLSRCRFGPFVPPYTSEFHLYAESMRISGLAGNSEELAGNRGPILPNELFATITWGDRERKHR
jgi:hypothetical protein